MTAEVLVVAGGGNATNGDGYGPGGAGGDVVYDPTYNITPQIYNVTVGARQQNSVFGTITAIKGGDGSTGSSNGGSNSFYSGGGYTYFNSGGGAGSGGIGGTGFDYTGGNGGVGLTCSISGTSKKYGAGGAGGGWGTGGTGGLDGGGVGHTYSDGLNGGNGTFYGAGGGGCYNTATQGIGYQGVVMVRWLTSDFGTCSVTGTGNSIITAPDDANYSLATMIVSGNLTIVGVPVLTTSPISSLSVSGFTANGEITNTGGVNATIRGFCYMIGSSGDPDIISNFEVHDDGDYSAGTYSKAITGLDIATNNYRVRAYAVNTIGTGYGQTITVSKTIKSQYVYGADAGPGTLPCNDNNNINSNTWREMQVMLNKSVQAGSLFTNGIVSTYALIQTLTNAYQGGVLAPNGDIHFIPFDANRGQKISAAGVVSTYSLVYTASNIASTGVLDSNGNIHFVPYDANKGQKISSSNVVSTYSLVYTGIHVYIGGVLAPNGDIHFIPYKATVGQKISAAGVVSTYSLVYTSSSGAYAGGVLAPNGDIHFVPSTTNIGQKISAAGVVSTYSLVYTNSSDAYVGGVLAPNGDIHFIPRSADRGQKIDINGVVSTYSLVYTGGTYIGGVLAPNGDIHLIPYSTSRGQKISAAGVVSTYSLVYTTSASYQGGVLAPNGDIHFIPCGYATVGQKISTNPAIPFSQAVCMSPFFNKF